LYLRRVSKEESRIDEKITSINDYSLIVKGIPLNETPESVKEEIESLYVKYVLEDSKKQEKLSRQKSSNDLQA
jgi:hypothetical protein